MIMMNTLHDSLQFTVYNTVVNMTNDTVCSVYYTVVHMADDTVQCKVYSTVQNKMSVL